MYTYIFFFYFPLRIYEKAARKKRRAKNGKKDSDNYTVLWSLARIPSN